MFANFILFKKKMKNVFKIKNVESFLVIITTMEFFLQLNETRL